MLQRKVFINKITYSTTNIDATTNAKEYYRPTVARACAWRVGPFRFD